MATATKPAPVTTVNGSEVRTFSEEETANLGRRHVASKPSPLQDLVKESLDTGVGKAVGITETYPKATIYAHLRKAERAVDSATHKLRIFGRDTDKAWPHVGFKWVERKTETPVAKS